MAYALNGCCQNGGCRWRFIAGGHPYLGFLPLCNRFEVLYDTDSNGQLTGISIGGTSLRRWLRKKIKYQIIWRGDQNYDLDIEIEITFHPLTGSFTYVETSRSNNSPGYPSPPPMPEVHLPEPNDFQWLDPALAVLASARGFHPPSIFYAKAGNIDREYGSGHMTGGWDEDFYTYTYAIPSEGVTIVVAVNLYDEQPYNDYVSACEMVSFKLPWPANAPSPPPKNQLGYSEARFEIPLASASIPVDSTELLPENIEVYTRFKPAATGIDASGIFDSILVRSDFFDLLTGSWAPIFPAVQPAVAIEVLMLNRYVDGYQYPPGTEPFPEEAANYGSCFDFTRELCTRNLASNEFWPVMSQAGGRWSNRSFRIYASGGWCVNTRTYDNSVVVLTSCQQETGPHFDLRWARNKESNFHETWNWARVLKGGVAWGAPCSCVTNPLP